MLAIAEPRARPKAEHFYRPVRVRDGPVFCFICQHFVLGYFRPVPAPKAFEACGTDFGKLQPMLGRGCKTGGQLFCAEARRWHTRQSRRRSEQAGSQ
jgi:hypothetical protein